MLVNCQGPFVALREKGVGREGRRRLAAEQGFLQAGLRLHLGPRMAPASPQRARGPAPQAAEERREVSLLWQRLNEREAAAMYNLWI